MPSATGEAPSEALSIDLYELTMAETYFERGMDAPASFELFVRRLPPGRNFLIAAGLEQALDFLETFRFTADDRAHLATLARTGQLSTEFVDRLGDVRFTGEAWAMPEGTVFFANEPLLRVTAPIGEAQLVETRLINLLHLQTAVASKAARAVLAARGRKLVDFGLRRAHGAEAGLYAARAAYVAGFDGTSNVQAGARFGLPVFGTMAHSFVQAHDDEEEAFEHFAVSHPRDVVLLIDTYDTEAAAQKVVALAGRLGSRGITVKAVRIDSGDLAAHARAVRGILDAGGLREVAIVASSGLDERDIDHLVRVGAPIDTFAPGTRIVTSFDAPYLDCAYKLVEYAGRPRLKRSEGKATYPGRKQVSRGLDGAGFIARDQLHLADEPGDGAPLLERVMSCGRRLVRAPLSEARRRAAESLATLPPALRELEPAAAPPLEISRRLEDLRRG
jgi:nicotinate phosphoribosyltransferase